MSVARASRTVAAVPEAAFALWVDVDRWSDFVDGFLAVDSVDRSWPEPGSSVVWRSVVGGRGRVVERVVECEPAVRFVTDIHEEALTGRQQVLFERQRVALTLDYRLTTGGPLRWLTDVLFIRRAESEALARTLVRFAAETKEL